LDQFTFYIARMELAGMLSVHRFLPIILCVILPQGSTGKPHKPDKRRQITDAGAPRAPLTSAQASWSC
jgi:hypothetical protein